ncbi:MAG: hypothetical protein CMK09_03495 [Ponticaulis sp.]|nr:hypothetical protein [Ponticaulis sp.]|tara:strand:- start:12680 stop:13759 length:1080 start_codon:yes stop_codon:yes gene_type:complete
MKRLVYLDSLRGIAILGVVLIHVGQSIDHLPVLLKSFSNFGFRGVQLFFIVSALTLCIVTKPEKFDPASFYTRRFFRIAPMFYLAIVVYTLLAFQNVMQASSIEIQPYDIVATTFFVHGFVPHSINTVVPGGWSIACEAIFYALFPLALRYVTNIRLAAVLLILSFAAAVGNKGFATLFLTEAQKAGMWGTFFHFNFLTNLPAFASGIFLYHLIKKWPDTLEKTRLGDLKTLVVLSALIAFSVFSAFIPAAQILVIPILAALVYAAARWDSVLLVNPVLAFLGEISFSLYLVHFIVIHFLEPFIPGALPPYMQLIILFLVVLVVGSLLSTLTYRYIEQPMVKLGRRLSNSIGQSLAKST